MSQEASIVCLRRAGRLGSFTTKQSPEASLTQPLDLE
jgi:hypothetical protein